MIFITSLSMAFARVKATVLVSFGLNSNISYIFADISNVSVGSQGLFFITAQIIIFSKIRERDFNTFHTLKLRPGGSNTRNDPVVRL